MELLIGAIATPDFIYLTQLGLHARNSPSWRFRMATVEQPDEISDLGQTSRELNANDNDEEDPNEIRVITSIRYDPALVKDENRHWRSTMSSGATPSPLLLLPYHHDRLVAAATAFGWKDAARGWSGGDGLTRLAHECEEAVREVHPMRNSPGDKTAFKVSTRSSIKLRSSNTFLV